MILLKRTPLFGLLSTVTFAGASACSSNEAPPNAAGYGIAMGDGSTVNGDAGKGDQDCGAAKLDAGRADPDGGTVPSDGGTDGTVGFKGGTIFMALVKPTPTTYSTFAYAQFWTELPPGDETGSCESRASVGNCDVRVCDLGRTSPDGGAPGGGAVDGGLTAGDITISGGKISSASPLVFTADATKNYPPKSGTEQNYAGGDVLVVDAAGGDVPAFHGAVKAPATLSGFAPALSLTAPLRLNRSVDFILNWKGGQAGYNAFVTLGTDDTVVAKKSVTVSCSVDAAMSKLVIPKDALKWLLDTSATVKGTLTVLQHSQSRVKAGDYTVDLDIAAGGNSTFTTR